MPTRHTHSLVRQGTRELRTETEAKTDLRRRGVVVDIPGKSFLATHLAGTTGKQSWPPELEQLVDEIKTWKTDEHLLYTGSAPLLRLLNSISLWILCSQRSPEAQSQARTLVFRACHENLILHPSHGNKLFPDIVVEWATWDALQRLSTGTSGVGSPSRLWSDLAAVGEVKLKKQDGTLQLGNYLQNLLQLHPEQNAVLGLSVEPSGYRLFYHDASVIHRSDAFCWTPGPLYSFIEKLYKNDFRDHSLAVLSTNGGSGRAYAINIESRRLVSHADRPEPGPGQRRFIAIMFDIYKRSDLFQKDSWRDFRRRFFEGLMYAKAHHEAHIPGLMTILFYGYVLDASRRRLETTVLQPEGRRAKMRLISEDVGLPLEGITSLSHFLRVMYDACVVQRNLYRKCGILHRDISDNNIMVAPSNPQFKKHCDGSYFDNVKYINQILAGDRDVKPEPACLVIDLGNGADLGQVDNVKVLTERTGTPKFIARSVSYGELLSGEYYSSAPLAMPKLEGRSLELYKSKNEAEYTKYTEMVQQRPYDDAAPPKVEHKHQLFHDAESTFWVTAWVLARSAPTDYKKETKWPVNLGTFIQGMETHQPGVNYSTDTRGEALHGLTGWKDVLHSSLASVAPMLHQMHRYVRPEWQYRPELDVEHVHEALMRLLVTEIVRIEDSGADVQLAIGGRVLPTVIAPKLSQGNTHSSSIFLPPAQPSNTQLMPSDAPGDVPDAQPTDVGETQPESPPGPRRTLQPEPMSEHPGLIADVEAYSWEGEYGLETPVSGNRRSALLDPVLCLIWRRSSNMYKTSHYAPDLHLCANSWNEGKNYDFSRSREEAEAWSKHKTQTDDYFRRGYEAVGVQFWLERQNLSHLFEQQHPPKPESLMDFLYRSMGAATIAVTISTTFSTVAETVAKHWARLEEKPADIEAKKKLEAVFGLKVSDWTVVFWGPQGMVYNPRPETFGERKAEMAELLENGPNGGVTFCSDLHAVQPDYIALRVLRFFSPAVLSQS
ncbi:hypothetical protein FRC10_006110 [Ceratobasidium sp. 414]|nr:hypothetical protein FRC10_006110 [Ceratobasidium sp. 414]